MGFSYHPVAAGQIISHWQVRISPTGAPGTWFSADTGIHDASVKSSAANRVSCDGTGAIYVTGTLWDNRDNSRVLIRKSMDGGHSWFTVYETPLGGGIGQTACFNLVNQANRTLALSYGKVVGQAKIQQRYAMSSDGGRTWQDYASPLPDVPYDPGHSHSGSCNFPAGSISDSGEVLTVGDAGAPGSWLWRSFALNPATHKARELGRIPIPRDVDWSAARYIQADEAGRIFIGGSYRQKSGWVHAVYRSLDHGNSWQQVDNSVGTCPLGVTSENFVVEPRSGHLLGSGICTTKDVNPAGEVNRAFVTFSPDSGKSWHSMLLSPQAPALHSAAYGAIRNASGTYFVNEIWDTLSGSRTPGQEYISHWVVQQLNL